jgi:hypothetical protein
MALSSFWLVATTEEYRGRWLRAINGSVKVVPSTRYRAIIAQLLGIIVGEE